MSHTKKHVLRKRKTTQRCKSCGKLFHFNGGWKLKSVKSRSKSRTRSRSKF